MTKLKMTLDGVKELVNRSGVGYLATTDGRRAAVRPMGSGVWVGDEFWLAATPRSAKAADIRKRPGIELCFMDKKWNHVRIEGDCTVSVAFADQRKFVRLCPGVKQHVDRPFKTHLAVLRIRPTRIRIMPGDTMDYSDIPIRGE